VELWPKRKKKLKSTRNEIPCRMSDTFGGTGGRESRKNKAEKETARSTVFLISPPSLNYFFLFFNLSFLGALKFLCTPFFVRIHCTAEFELVRVNSSIAKRRSILWPLFHFFDSCRTQSETPFFSFYG
jgi:hypothetical protein